MIIWLIVIVLLVAIDQITKALVVANFTNIGETVPVIRNFFHITYVRNDSGVFGIDFIGRLTNLSPDKYYIVYLIVMGIAVGLFAYMFAKNDFKDKKLFWYSLSLTLLIAGAIGNAADRVFQFDHNVVDFIDFRGIWVYVFNMADVFLNVGIAIFIIDQFFLEPKRKKQVSG